MAFLSPRAPVSWRALAGALARVTRRAATAAGVTSALLLGDAAFRPAAAAPTAAAAPAAAPTPKVAKGKPAKNKGTKAKTAKAKGKQKQKATARSARRVRSATRSRSSRAAAARRAARTTPTAPPVAAIELPTVALPDLALTTDTDAAVASWEAALGNAPSTAQPATSRLVALSRSATSLLDGLVARARSQLGTRYVYGGAEPGAELDCSSFVRYVMEALDVQLPRTANQQARVGRPVPRDPAQLRPGDLLTFGRGRRTSHVGIYLGEGRFIHASVKSGQVIETTIARNRSLFRRWQGARRLLAGADSLTSGVAGDG